MKQLPVRIMVLGCLWFTGIGVAHAVGAHGGTVERNAVTPMASELVAKMRSAIRAKGEYHVDSYLNALVPGQYHMVAREHEDLWLRLHRSHGHGTTRWTALDTVPPTTTVSGGETWVANSHTFDRGSNGTTGCSSSHWVGGADPTYAAGLFEPYLDKARTTAIKMLGTDVLRGIAVWHVHEELSFYGLHTQMSLQRDLYISQTDYTLLHEIANATGVLTETSGTVVTTTLRENDWYSSYGQAANFTMPKCR